MKFSSPPGTRVLHVMRGRAPSVRLSNRPGNSHERRATCPLSRFHKGHSAGAEPCLRATTLPRRNFSSDHVLSRCPDAQVIYHFQHQEARKKKDIVSVFCRGGLRLLFGKVSSPAGADPCSLGPAILRIQPGWPQKRLDISYCSSRITN